MNKTIYRKTDFFILIITLLLTSACNNNIDKEEAIRQIAEFYEFSLNNKLPDMDCYEPGIFISDFSGKIPPYYTLITTIGIPNKNIGRSDILMEYRKLSELGIIQYTLQDNYAFGIINAQKNNSSLSECLYIKNDKFRDYKNNIIEAMMYIGTIIKMDDVVTSTSSDGMVAEVIVNFNLDFTSTLMKHLQPEQLKIIRNGFNRKIYFKKYDNGNWIIDEEKSEKLGIRKVYILNY